MGNPTDEPPVTFEGALYRRPESGVDLNYERHRYQYATSSLPSWQMRPAAILYAAGDEDVIKCIELARVRGTAVSIRSGGHCFDGCSSTWHDNLQIDMARFRDFAFDPATETVTVGAGLRNQEINDRLASIRRSDRPEDAANHPFFAHGNCAQVGIGGHLHTGGYSLFSRSFGMFIDFVVRFRIILADVPGCRVLWVHRPDAAVPDFENDELWYAVLGGSPGNFGVVTHITIRLLWDRDYPESRGYQQVYLYRDLLRGSLSTASGKRLLQHMLERLAAFNDDDTWPADFNFSVALAGPSSGGPGGALTRDHLSELSHALRARKIDGVLPHPALVVVNASWCNLSGDRADFDARVRSWFASLHDDLPEECKRLRIHAGDATVSATDPTPMSTLWTRFTYQGSREFDLPYVRRNYGGTTPDLGARGFAAWMADQLDDLVAPLASGVTISAAFCVTGGAESRTVKNARENPTALGNRTEIRTNCCLDGFYNTRTLLGTPWRAPRTHLTAWMRRMQDELVGSPRAKFTTLDRRFLYDPFDAARDHVGQVNLDALHAHFFDNEAVYQRVLATKRRVDPDHVFTPNLFCVGATDKYDPAEFCTADGRDAGASRKRTPPWWSRLAGWMMPWRRSARQLGPPAR